MANPAKALSKSPPFDEENEVEDLLATVQSVWSSVRQAPAENQPKLRSQIAQTIRRLKTHIDKSLAAPPKRQLHSRLLFDDREGESEPRNHDTEGLLLRFPVPALRVFDKDLSDHALRHLSESAKFHDVEELRKYLTERLRFNSTATRQRAANYLLNRFFPTGVLHRDLTEFCAATAGTAALGEALFYLTCRTEKIVSMVAEQVVFPSLPEGGPLRSRILDYVQTQFPRSKSVKDIAQAIVRTYDRFGIGTATRARLRVTLREGSLVAFAYVLHLEFSEPGMHSFERLFDGPMQKWLLWDKQWMVRQLYRLREVGVLAKVSEIDRMRQFTTKYSLADAVKPIVALAKEALS